MQYERHSVGTYSSLSEDSAQQQSSRQQKLDRQRALLEEKKKQKRLYTGMVVANANVTRPLSSRGLKSTSRPASSQGSLTNPLSLGDDTDDTNYSVTNTSIVTATTVQFPRPHTAEDSSFVTRSVPHTHLVTPADNGSGGGDCHDNTDVPRHATVHHCGGDDEVKPTTTQQRLAELGMAASVDYRDDQDRHDSKHHSSDEEIGFVAIAPAKMDTPTSSPDQLPGDTPTCGNNGNSQSKQAIAKPPKPQESIRVGNLEAFAIQPVTQGSVVQCRITRDKHGLDRGMYPIYHLHLDQDGGDKVFLMAARLRKKSRSSNYLLSVDPLELKRNSPSFIGKLRANFVGTSFNVFDNGVNPSKSRALPGGSNCRQELAAVTYETNVFGFKGPRKMNVVVPAMTPELERYVIKPTKESEMMMERYKVGRMDDLLLLQNKQPQWSDDSQAYVLNFRGRVTQASVKNFQLVHTANLEYIVLQFGRVSEDTFTMDVQFPLCPLQAFAICLSSLDSKLACE